MYKFGGCMKKLFACLFVFCAVFTFVSAQTHEKKIYNDGQLDYVPTGAKIKLIPVDTEIDIDRIMYRLDSSEEAEYTDLIPLTEEGRHIISYYAIDKLGNTHKDKVYTVILDKTAAVVTYAVEGPLYTDENGVIYFNKDTKFYLTADDALSGVAGVYAAIEGEEFAAVASDGQAYVLDEAAVDGEYVMNAYAVDNVGNVSEISSLKYFKDTVGPVVAIASADELLEKEGNMYTNRKNTFSVSATDDYTGVKTVFVSVDDAPWVQYEEPVNVATPGDHVIKAYAIDGLGNAGEVAELKVKLAVSAPDSTLEVVFGEEDEVVSSNSDNDYAVEVTDTADVPADSSEFRK